MAKPKATPASTVRRCIGSTKFGIEAHEAPPDQFPIQPSQKDGLGRMCRPHWNAYTTALRKASLARKAGEEPTVELVATPESITRVSDGAVVAPRGKAADPAEFLAVGLAHREKVAMAKRESASAQRARLVAEQAAATIAAIDILAGEAYTDAVGSDEVQATLETLNGAHHEKVTDEASEDPGAA